MKVGRFNDFVPLKGCMVVPSWVSRNNRVVLSKLALDLHKKEGSS